MIVYQTLMLQTCNIMNWHLHLNNAKNIMDKYNLVHKVDQRVCKPRFAGSILGRLCSISLWQLTLNLTAKLSIKAGLLQWLPKYDKKCATIDVKPKTREKDK
jgi:hypothetical protein